MRKDQRGFTIVELLIAVAILSIVVASVCAFIVVGSRSYASANSDINVQQEAQLSLNQMSDVLIDTTRSVNYVGYDAGGNTQKALKDAEFTFTPEDKSLIMYNGVVEETPAAVPGGTPTKTVDAGNGNKHYHFYWSKDAETLYYAELDVQSTDVDTAAIHFPAFDPTDPAAAGWVVLAERVTDFSVDLSQVEEKRVVQLALTFLDGRKEYVTSNNVTIRNKVGVNDAELAPLNKKKSRSDTPRDAG
ncbi:MAG: type II secretion system GspH family protein, partial [Lachnospiraceae bacterium]|nr:type II secretion system GspH family protein [Lachnospiraceae bacterium]